MLTNYFCKCDKCGASRQFANRPFEEILATVRRDGWRVTKVEKGWRHYCAECVAKWSAARTAATREPMWWQKD